MHQQIKTIIDKWVEKKEMYSGFVKTATTQEYAEQFQENLEIATDAWNDLWFIKRLVNQGVMMEKTLVFELGNKSKLAEGKGYNIGVPIVEELQELMGELEKEWTFVDVVNFTKGEDNSGILIVKVRAYAKN